MGETREPLFLGSAPATRGDCRRAALVAAALVAAFVATVPWADRPLAALPAFAPIYDAAVIVLDSLTALLLFAQYRQLRERAFLALACGYLFTPLLMAAHAVSFPDAYRPGSVIGGSQTTAWLWMGWHGLFPLFVAGYALMARRDHAAAGASSPAGRVAGAIWGTVALAGGVVLLATAGEGLLPELMLGNSYRSPTTRLILAAGWLAHLAALAVLAWSTRLRRLIDLWLAVTLVALLIDLALSAVLVDGRYQLGFYLGRAYGLLGAGIVLGVLLHQTVALSNRAVETAARLRESEARHRLIVEGARDYAILTSDPEGRIESWSPGAEAVFGWSAEEIVGRPAEVTFTPEDREAGAPERELAEAAATGSAPDVRWHLRSDGARVFIDGVTRALHGPDGGLRGFLKIGQDVTRRRETEEALRRLNETLEQRVEERTREVREQEERFRTLVETAGLMVWTTDADGQMVEDSPSWRAFTGQTYEEAHGRGWADAVHPDDRPAAVERWSRSVRTGAPADSESRIWHAPSGSWRWTNARAVPLRGADGAVRGWIGMNIDVHARRHAEAARAEVLRQLVTAEEEERRRISRELHDQMGQQVTALLLGLKALERAAAGGERARIETLQALADRIARDLQGLALELRPPALDNLGLRLALQSQLEEWSERHGIACDFHAAGVDGDRFPPEVEATIYRVVQEGLTNVLKHAGATHVSLVLERRRGVVSAILEDDGRGFDVEATLAAPEKARRLGLRGMRERVALLGGELHIESAPGSGTTVFVRLADPAVAKREGER